MKSNILLIDKEVVILIIAVDFSQTVSNRKRYFFLNYRPPKKREIDDYDGYLAEFLWCNLDEDAVDWWESHIKIVDKIYTNGKIPNKYKIEKFDDIFPEQED